MTKDDIKKKVRTFLKKYIKEEITDDQNLFKSGLISSLFAMQLVLFVEKDFKIKVENEDLGVALDFQTDLGYREETQYVESVSRVGLGRFSFRTHYYTPIKGLSSELSRLDWPQLRFGGDVDLICTSAFRVGANVDYFPKKPKFVLGDSIIGSASFELPNPITAGAHLAFGSVTYTGIALSMEASWRTSIEKSLDYEEAEVAL